MKITPKFRHVSGSFDTDKHDMVCVKSHKYKEVQLCIKDGMNFPIAEIKLFNEDRWSHKEAVYDDACKLGDEIARRWNEAKTEASK